MDEEMQLALAMSMSQGGGGEGAPAAPPPAAPAEGGDLTAMFQDANFVQSVLGSLPGVDPSDPRIQSVLSSLPANPEDKEAEAKKKKDEGGGSS